MEILNETEIDIKKLYESPEGTEENLEFEIEGDAFLESFTLDSPLTGKLRLIKEKEGILAFLDELQVQLALQCDFCLEDAKLKLEISHKNREYLARKKPNEKLGELEEENLFRIDLARMTIDLTEFLRQEVILAKPDTVYCKKTCKGLCPECGCNLNLESCDCPKSTKNSQNPFQNLKDMLKEQ